MDTGKKIALCRKEAGMSQEALAAEMGISRQAVSRWETGEALPETAKVILLARLFNVSCDYLLLDEVENKDARQVYIPGDHPVAIDAVRERRRKMRFALGVSTTVTGFLCLAATLLYAMWWAENTTWWSGNLGKFGTGLLRTGAVIPLLVGIVLLMLGGLMLTNEYMRED